MFPNNINPLAGRHILNHIIHILDIGCEAKVISLVPYSPKILSFNSKWKRYGNIDQKKIISEIPVCYPRYLALPGKWFYGISHFTMYHGIQDIAQLIIKQFKPDIIHAHTAIDGWVGLMIAKKYKIPVLCTFRGSDINIYPYYGRLGMSLTRKLISEAHQLVSVSKALKGVANSIANPRKEISVVYNGCDMATFSYNEAICRRIRGRLGISEEEKVIMFVGNVIKTKGVFELINAFLELKRKYSKLHLIIIGDGPECKMINRLAEINGFAKKVHLIGKISQSEVASYLSAADLFTLPTYYEGLPNVVLEAMSCCLPIVATKVGGIPEIVKDGINGILIKEKDTNSLIEALEYLLCHVEAAKTMGMNGRKMIEENFSWKQNAKKIMNIYRELIDQ